MSARTLFIIGAIAALPFGVGFLLAPVFVMNILGVALDAGGVLMTRFFGALLVNLGILFLLLRELRDAETVRSIITAYFIGDVIGLIVAVMGIVSGTFNSLGWLIVILYGGLALLAAYFLFARQSMPVARSGVR